MYLGVYLKNTSVVLVGGGGKLMEEVKRNLLTIEQVLNRYALRLGCCDQSLLAASYIAMRRCYKGENYKQSIRQGKLILDHLTVKENEV